MFNILTTSVQSSGYDSNEFYNDKLNKRYYLDNHERSYEDSISFCESYNGRLVQIKSKNESDWIRDNLPLDFMVNGFILGKVLSITDSMCQLDPMF